jgi:hypothetical protein
MDPRAGLDDMEKRKFLTIPGLELRPLGRPSRSQSLYRLSYPDLTLLLALFVTVWMNVVVDKVALGLVLFEYFGFFCQFPFH